jgi:pyoverdine/dityrosine biosynthesis protein Dit1
VATYSSSYEAKQALVNAEAQLKKAKEAKNSAAIKSWTKEVKNIKFVLSAFPKDK